MTIKEALDRTLLLMRDDISDAATDEQLVDALTSNKVCIIANQENISSHSAQTAFVTAAMLLARSGHQVYLSAPEVMLCGYQPPLRHGDLIEQLVLAGKDLLPGRDFRVGLPKQANVAILFGDSEWKGRAELTWRIQASAWGGRITRYSGRLWRDEEWPIGALAVAGLISPEVFKVSMRRLRRFAKVVALFDETYAPTSAVTLNLAPTNPQKVSELVVDFISGGAITNSALYSLLRVPHLRGKARIVEDDTIAFSNLNRCMLFRRKQVGDSKASVLCEYATSDFVMTPENSRFSAKTKTQIGRLADAVLVGVDHIPSRWEVQHTWPKWLGVGATSHFSAMASYHTPSLPCAGCAHPVDHPIPGPIATVSFVSFWAGLWTAALYLRYLANDRGLNDKQQYYYSPLRPEILWHSGIQRRPDCPVKCRDQVQQAG